MIGVAVVVYSGVLPVQAVQQPVGIRFSIDDAFRIVLAVGLSTLVTAVVPVDDRALDSDSHLFRAMFLMIFFVGGSRMLFRVHAEQEAQFEGDLGRKNRPRTLIVGAGETGSLAIDRMLEQRPEHARRSHRGSGRQSREEGQAHPRHPRDGLERRHRRPRRALRYRADRRGHSLGNHRAAQAHLRHLHADELPAAHASERARAADRRDQRRAAARSGRGRPARARGGRAQHAHGERLHRRQDRPRHRWRRVDRFRALPPDVRSGAQAHRHLRHVRERRVPAAQRADARVRRHRLRGRDWKRVRYRPPGRCVQEVPPVGGVPCGGAQARAAHGDVPARGHPEQRVRHAEHGERWPTSSASTASSSSPPTRRSTPRRSWARRSAWAR